MTDLTARGTATIAATPQQILEWVLDLDRYRTVDTKIAKVLTAPTLDAEGRGRVRYRGRLRGLPSPVDTQDVTLDRWRSLTLTGAPEVWTRRLFDFTGTFTCTLVDGGTEVIHTETFRFRPAPMNRLAVRLLQGWLDRSMVEEMADLTTAIESSRSCEMA